MADRYLDPARSIIAKFGGPSQVSRALGLDYSRPYRWMKPKSEGGTGGTIPTKHQQALLDLAEDRGIKLEPADFFSSRPRQRGNAAVVAA